MFMCCLQLLLTVQAINWLGLEVNTVIIKALLRITNIM
jgi:hypothetical protein